MAFIKRNIVSILLSIFVIAVLSVFYTPMYAFQEGLSIFMFNLDFFVDTCLRPGGISDYIGCYLTQYFMYPQWTVGIITLFILGIQLITKSLFAKNSINSAEPLSLLCALAFLAAIVSFNIIFGGCVAIFLAVVASKLTNFTQNKVLLTILTPIIYFISGGWCCLIYISACSVGVFANKKFVFFAINLSVLIFSWLITKKLMQDDSLFGTFTGVDFNRYPEKKCPIWFVSVFIIVASIIFSRCDKIYKKAFVRLSIIIASIVGVTIFMLTKYDSVKMLNYKIDRLVRYKKWSEIVSIMHNENNPTPFAQCYLNMALNELGMLDSKMFNFVQIGPDGLCSSSIDTQEEGICHSEIFFRLGLMNISERWTMESIEAINTFQKSARFYKRLAEIAIIKNDKNLAIRYLRKLQATTFYSAWAYRAEQYLNAPDKVEPLADWKIQPLKFDKDFFYSENYKSELFLLLLANNPNNIKVFNYYICYLLLEKNVAKIYDFVSKYRPEGKMGLHIYEAILLYLSQNNSAEFKQVMMQNNVLTRSFQQFGNFMSSPDATNFQKAKELFGNSYWFYYVFSK